ncbi:Protein of unknown function [Cotesia congregata]|uniref:Uncharacterized protein n=1 Tax=Cotesia congregata TaxID=51543 RepID=A0A8J2HS52_COTCN|nr:Protein of unknown function [Cotesia congregata]
MDLGGNSSPPKQPAALPQAGLVHDFLGRQLFFRLGNNKPFNSRVDPQVFKGIDNERTNIRKERRNTHQKKGTRSKVPDPHSYTLRVAACLPIFIFLKATRPRVRSRGPLKSFGKITDPCARNRYFRELPMRARATTIYQ